MINLSATNRCELFEAISDDVWAHIKFNHTNEVEVSEIGVTNDIIAAIRSKNIYNIGVWAEPGYDEIQNGSDIDIFVETSTGAFVWYALQAKVLRRRGIYEGFATLRGGEYQWDKLNRLAATAGCFAKYLLYNGVNTYNDVGKDTCGRAFAASQFGCSLVDTNTIQRLSVGHNPTFAEIHPNNAQPWRVIVCCKQNTTGKTVYSLSQVKASLKRYEKVVGNEAITLVVKQEELNKYDEDVINTFSEEVSRVPAYRMVIRNTTSLELSSQQLSRNK